jgi:hypothetical protein
MDRSTDFLAGSSILGQPPSHDNRCRSELFHRITIDGSWMYLSFAELVIDQALAIHQRLSKYHKFGVFIVDVNNCLHYVRSMVIA